MTTLITTDPKSNRQYRINDARRKEWFLHYSDEGAGFGYLSFEVRRPEGYYPDLNYGNTATLLKGPFKVLFSGQIVRITQGLREDGDVLIVWVLGWIHVAGNNRFNRIYCDTRLREWFTVEESDGDLRPNKFNVSTSEDVMALEPRRGIELGVGEYISVFYAFPFGETAARITGDYQMSIPTAWSDQGGGLTLAILDGNESELWSTSVDGSGSFDLEGSGSSFEIRLYFSGDSAGVSTRNDVFAAIANLKTFSTKETVSVSLIAQDVAKRRSSEGHGLSSSVAAIDDVGGTLDTAAFVDDKTPK